MTVRAEDIEPESGGARGPVGQVIDWRSDPTFTWPERLPWSEIGPYFMDAWSPPTGSNYEHWEIIGPSGSGKTHLLLTALQDHYRTHEAYRVENDRKHITMGAILVLTKQADEIFQKLGWPVVHSTDEVRETNFVFWPQTSKTGSERKIYQEARVRPLMERLWQKNANTVLAFDEVARVEGLSGETRVLVQQYWQEARSMHIQMVGMKQRPQGALRDMHSETFWTAMFKPGEGGDDERFAELLGRPRDWMPVLNSLSLDRHEFVLRHSRSGEAYISWVDTPLTPQKIKRRGYRGLMDARQPA